MSNINQLLAKALSTTSEEEAMSCLRMARKKGGRLDDSSSADYNGHDARYWYDKAALYYTKAKEKSDGLTHEQQKHLYRLYESECNDARRLRQEKHVLESEIRKLKDKPTGVWWMVPVMVIQFILIMALIQMTG